ncbi:MAG: tetratricopeptide repeat protein [Planctomycetes bacterium]|nr:tetratricopeptide repeat protein [Planctomycetota bacterium]
MQRVTPTPDTTIPTARSKSESPLLAVAVILFATLAAYSPLRHAGYIWDDDDYLTKNTLVQTTGGLSRIWIEPAASPQYYPLVFTTFWLEHKLWGLHPLGYHVVNVLLHALNAVLVWRLLTWLRVPAALWAALVFALHPVNVESVAWITERKNVLSAFFYLLSLHALLTHLLRDHEKPRSPNAYILALVTFACALLSKSVTASLPAAALVIVWWKRGRISRDVVRATVPFFAIGLAAALHTAWLEKHHVGAENVDWGLSPITHLILAGRILWFYFHHLLWPAEQIFFYPKWSLSAADVASYIFPLGVIALAAVLYSRRHRIGRAPAAAMMLFCGTLVPVLGFAKVYPMLFSFVADHFVYLAGIALFAATTALIHRALHAFLLPRVILATATCTILGVLTWNRCGAYRDEETLWRDTIKRNDQAFAAFLNLGMLVHDRGQTDEAVMLLRRAIEIRPNYEIALDNLGMMLLKENRTDEAFDLFRRATEANPYYASAQRNYGRMLCERGQLDEGIRHIEAAILIRPHAFESYEDLANAQFRLGRIADAISNYRRVLERNPDYPLGACNLASALTAIGQFDDAVKLLDAAIQRAPDSAQTHYTLGTIRMAQNRAPDAIAAFRAALKHQPNFPPAHTNLAVALEQSGQRDEALAHFRAAASQSPDDADAHFNLARALESRGLRDEAMKEYREVLRINPDEQEARKALGGG